MKTASVLGFILCLCALAGCSGSGGMIPLSDESISTVATGATTSMGYITDASVMKEMAVHKSLQNRDKMVKDAHANSGFKMEFMLVEVSPGVKALMPKEIKYNEQAKFDQPLPQAPSEHPGWRTAERIGVAAINGTVVGLGVTTAGDVLKSAIGNAGTKSTYNGDVSNKNSHNTGDNHNYNDSAVSSESMTDASDHSVGAVTTTGAVDNSNNSVGPVTTDTSNNSQTDNSTGPVDNSDNSTGPVDNSDNSTGPVDNSSIKIAPPVPLS